MNGNINPWVVQEAKQYTELPAAFYTCRYRGVEDFQLPEGKRQGDNDDGKRWLFRFEVSSGTHAGATVTAMTKPDIKQTTHAGRIIQGLLGRPLQAGDNVKALVEECQGKTYLAQVAKGPKGGKVSVQTVGQPPQ